MAQKSILGSWYPFVVKTASSRIYMSQIMDNDGKKYCLLVEQRPLFGQYSGG
jgi:hypothetical protein